MILKMIRTHKNAFAALNVREEGWRGLIEAVSRKPENVVIDREGHCLLTDFGLSKEGVAELTKSFCGSLAFLAPEVLQNRGHGHTVDIYGRPPANYWLSNARQRRIKARGHGVRLTGKVAVVRRKGGSPGRV